MITDKKIVKCRKCGYIWATKSKMVYVCCPRCMMKVRLKMRKRKVKR